MLYLPAEPAPFRTAAESLQNNESRRSKAAIFWLSLALLIGVPLGSLTSPHLRYYDLCVLVPAGALLLSKSGPWLDRIDLRRIAICGWVLVSGFLMPMLAFAGSKIIPLILESILTVLFFVLLQRLAQNPAAKYGQPANNL